MTPLAPSAAVRPRQQTIYSCTARFLSQSGHWPSTFQISAALLPHSATQSFRSWWTQGHLAALSREGQTKWAAASILVCWFIWTEHNARIFRNLKNTTNGVIDKIIDEIHEWSFVGLKGATLLLNNR